MTGLYPLTARCINHGPWNLEGSRNNFSHLSWFNSIVFVTKLDQKYFVNFQIIVDKQAVSLRYHFKWENLAAASSQPA